MEENKIVWQADNLPSNSKLWVRQVKKLLLSLTKQVSSLALETSRSFKTLDTNLGIVTRNARQVELNVESLHRVVELIPITNTFGERRTNYNIPSGQANVIQITVPWIEGKTSCTVTANGIAAYFSTQNQANLPAWRINIGDSIGPFGIDGYYKLDSYTAVILHSQVIENPVDFTVSLITNAGGPSPASVENSAQLQVTVVFT